MRTTPIWAGLLLLAACGDSGENDLVHIPAPPSNESPVPDPHRHSANPKLPKPDAASVEKGAIRIAEFMTRMAVYGFFPEQDTVEKRAAFAKAKVEKLPPFAVQDLLSKDLDKPEPSVTVNLLEMDPANLLTLPADYHAERFAEDLSLVTRGAVEPAVVRKFMANVTQETFLDHVAKLQAAQFKNGKLCVFMLEGRPVGIAYCGLEAFKAIEDDKFNPYLPSP